MRLALLLITVAVMLGTFVALQAKRQAIFRSYTGAKYIYDRTSAVQVAVAESLPEKVINIGEASGPELPQLILSSGQVLSGYRNIRQALQPFLESDTPEQQGQRATVLLASAAIVAWMFPAFCRRFSLLATIPAIFALIALGSECATCVPFRQGILASAPTLGLIVFSIIFCILAFSSLSSRVLLSVAGLMVAVPLTQAALIFFEPRLCPACIVIGASSSVISQGLARRSEQEDGYILSLPHVWNYCAALIFFMSVGRTSLAATNVLPFAHANKAGEFVRKTLASFVKVGPPAPGAWVITSVGCSACETAKIGIRDLSGEVGEIPACTTLSSGPCFDPGSSPLGTPTFIIVDSHGLISWQHVGWPESASDQADFKKEILLRKNNAIR